MIPSFGFSRAIPCRWGVRFLRSASDMGRWCSGSARLPSGSRIKRPLNPKSCGAPDTSPVPGGLRLSTWPALTRSKTMVQATPLSTQISSTPRFCAPKSGIVFYPAGGEIFPSAAGIIFDEVLRMDLVCAERRKRKKMIPHLRSCGFTLVPGKAANFFEHASADDLYPGARLGARGATSGSHGDGQWLAVQR